MVLSWLLLLSIWPVPWAWFMLTGRSCQLYPGKRDLQNRSRGNLQEKLKRKQRLGFTPRDFCSVMGLLSFQWCLPSGLIGVHDKVGQIAFLRTGKVLSPNAPVWQFACLRIASHLTSLLGAWGERGTPTLTEKKSQFFATSQHAPGDCSGLEFLETCSASIFVCDG